MNKPASYLALFTLLGSTCVASAAVRTTLLTKKTDSGTIVGYQDTPLLPATGNKYHVHDVDRPIPKQVTPAPPGKSAKPPSDAIVLFEGKDLSKWQDTSWKTDDGLIEAGADTLETKGAFGDCQLHIEWRAPTTPPGRLMLRGNSGVIMMGLYEIQIFDSHVSNAVQIYSDGQAASIYGQTPPLVNACRAPGEWQTYDILFTAPVFDGDKLIQRAKITMLHNQVLVHLNQEIMGPMTHRNILPYKAHPAKLPLILQGHGSPVRFRNIWIRPLDR